MPALVSRSRCSSIRRISACVPVRKTRPRSSVYLSSSEAFAMSAAELMLCLLAQPLDSGASLDSRFQCAARLVPIRFGAEGFGKKFDEGAGLRRQEATMGVHLVNGHVGAEGISGAQRHQRTVLEMAAHVPRRLQRHPKPSERPLAQHFPVVARVAARDPDGARL